MTSGETPTKQRRHERWQVKVGNWELHNPLLKLLIGGLIASLVAVPVLLLLSGILAPVVGFILLVLLAVFILAIGLVFAILFLPLLIIIAPIALLVWLLTLPFKQSEQ